MTTTLQEPVKRPTPAPKPKRNYRLLEGKYFESDIDPETGNPVTRMYNKGDVIESTEDLRQFNANGYAPKFALADDSWRPSETTWNPERETIEQFALRMQQAGMVRRDTTSPQENSAHADATGDLRSLTLEQLYELADREEIDIAPGLTDRDAVMARILHSME